MIECSSEYIWYKKRRKKSLKRFAMVFVVLMVFISLYFYYKNNIISKIYTVCYDYAYSYSTESVNNAVLTSLSLNASYSDIVKIEKNSSDDIVLMQIDSVKVNKINKEIASNSSLILKEKADKGIPIPLFLFSGIKLISGYGPKINYKAVNVVSVNCDFDSIFNSVGINQTLHSIYIVVKCNVNIGIPLKNNQVVFENRILVCESILVGKVPDIYLNGKIFS